jgi:hypothetical protein
MIGVTLPVYCGGTTSVDTIRKEDTPNGDEAGFTAKRLIDDNIAPSLPVIAQRPE